jgi:hypothetical protein
MLGQALRWIVAISKTRTIVMTSAAAGGVVGVANHAAKGVDLAGLPGDDEGKCRCCGQ